MYRAAFRQNALHPLLADLPGSCRHISGYACSIFIPIGSTVVSGMPYGLFPRFFPTRIFRCSTRMPASSPQ
jgi:hypothetical protein